MKNSIIPILLVSIYALISACSSDESNVSKAKVESNSSLSSQATESKSYDSIGTYYYKCSCDQRPPVGGLGAKGVCYPPGSTVDLSPQDPHDHWPDFELAQYPQDYPGNNYTKNGYDFWLDPLGEVTFVFNCPSQGIAGVNFDTGGGVSCNKISHTSNSRTVQCHNKSKKDHHHLNINDYQYDDGSS